MRLYSGLKIGSWKTWVILKPARGPRPWFGGDTGFCTVLGNLGQQGVSKRSRGTRASTEPLLPRWYVRYSAIAGAKLPALALGSRRWAGASCAARALSLRDAGWIVFAHQSMGIKKFSI